MMTYEPKCITWKRLGAEHVRKQLEGMTLVEELEFWHQKTEQLRERQRKIRELGVNSKIVDEVVAR